MPRVTSSYVPNYRFHKPSGQARVTIEGHDFWLGPWKSKASMVEYDRIINEWLANGRRQVPSEQDDGIVIVELIAAYVRFARKYYRKDGRLTSEVGLINEALQRLRRLYGREQVKSFGPLKLKAVREDMLSEKLTRTYINKLISRIKRMFKWGVEEELVPGEVYQALTAVAGLRKGRCNARESKPVLPVSEADFQATLPHLPEVVCDMVRFQRLTGCRPGEVCIIRPVDVDRTADVWAYRPEHHKTEHHGRERVIFVGPKAQDVLRKYLLRPAWEYCFSPKESEAKRRLLAYQARKTPLSCGNRPGTNRKARPRKSAGTRYTNDSYRRAVHRACEKAGVPKWSPNQLRHSAATEIRKRFGLEAAQVTLGHASADVTQVYAERDLQRAARVMKEIG